MGLRQARTISPGTARSSRRSCAPPSRAGRLALANPQKAADAQLRYVASLKPEIIMAELKIVGDLAVTSDVREHGLGWFDPAGMKSALEFVSRHVGMTGLHRLPANIYAAGFLPVPAIKPLSSVAAGTRTGHDAKSCCQDERNRGRLPARLGRFQDVHQEFARSHGGPFGRAHRRFLRPEGGRAGDLAGTERLRKDDLPENCRRPHARHQRHRPDQRPATSPSRNPISASPFNRAT